MSVEGRSGTPPRVSGLFSGLVSGAAGVRSGWQRVSALFLPLTGVGGERVGVTEGWG